MHFTGVHVYFFPLGSKVIKGVNRSNLSKQSDSRYMPLIKSSTGSNWMGDQIKLSTGSNWMGDHIRSSMASNWMGDHTSPIIKGIRYPIIVKGVRHPVFFFFLY